MIGERKITQGPSKFDVMASLFDGKEVMFTIEGLGQLCCKVVYASQEDGSYNRWFFEFRLAKRMNEGVFKGFFDIQRRSGWLESESSERLSNLINRSASHT